MISIKNCSVLFFNENLIRKVWEKALIIEDMDSGIYRLDNCGALIKKALFLKDCTALSKGWKVDLIKPRSKGGTDELPNLQALQWENERAKAEFYPCWKCIVSWDKKENFYLK